MKNKIKILVVDDHEIVRKGLILVLHSDSELEVIHDCESAETALDYLLNNHNKIDILLTDVSMPGINGIELVKAVNKKYPAIKIIILSMHLDESYITSGLNSGATSYIAKDSNELDIIKAIKAAQVGESFLSEKVSKLLAKAFVNNANNKKSEKKLTPREKEILKLIVDGLNNKKIAEKLFISESTVNAHRYNLMKKLDAKNTADLVRMFLSKNFYI